MILPRLIQNSIEDRFFQSKIIIIYGARQVGKTVLLKEIQKKYPENSLYLNCDESDIRDAFSHTTSTGIKEFIRDKKLILLDEAQRVKNIGITLKLIADNFPDIQVVATGSSSFELSNTVVEPLTGRKFEYYLHPFSIQELLKMSSSVEIKRIIEARLIYGMYPDVVLKKSAPDEVLNEIAKSYLYKDILAYQSIRNPDALEKLLQALALQIGNEVSYTELAETVGIDKKTIENYIYILEKAFIIFRLNPFSRNLRNELKKLRKIYFIDTGIRNSLIKNFNPVQLRQDTGALWENFIICERIKYLSNSRIDRNKYFWRNHQKQEIDYIEEYEGRLTGYEIKYRKKSARIPGAFLKAYENSRVECINMDNFYDFVTAEAIK